MDNPSLKDIELTTEEATTDMPTQKRGPGRPSLGDKAITREERDNNYLARAEAEGLVRVSVRVPAIFADDFRAIGEMTREKHRANPRASKKSKLQWSGEIIDNI